MTRAEAPAAPRRSPKGDRRRKELVDIAARLFATHGFERTSLQDIADEAQLTKAAVYYHFPDKARLYEAVVVARLAESYAQVLGAVDLAPTPLEKVRAFARASAQRIDEDRVGWLAASHLTWSLGEQNRTPAIIAARDRLERLLRTLIAEAVEAGELRAVDPAMLARLIFSGINQIPRWHRPEGRLSARMVADQYLEMIVEGVRV